MTMPRGEHLNVHPLCLVFYVDDTGDELMRDPRHPVFGFGGCAMMAGLLEQEIGAPWRAMKTTYFGGADQALHASSMSKNATQDQLTALANFFKTARFFRFAAVLHRLTRLPEGVQAYQVLATSLLRRFEEITMRLEPPPKEILLIFEASERGDRLLEQYIGKLTVRTEGGEISIRQCLMDKAVGDPGLEIADFISNAAGGQARRWAQGREGFQRDFQAVFHHVPTFWSSFFCIDAAEVSSATMKPQS